MLQKLQRSGLYMAIAALCSLYSAGSIAHKLAPSLLQLDEIKAGIYQVVWRTPVYAQVFPEPSLPRTCSEAGGSTALVGSAIERRWVAECGGGLEGKAVDVKLLGESRTVAMLRFSPLGETVQRQMLTPEAPSYVVPERYSADSVFGEYIRVGIEHILIGVDHLLFVTALLLLADSRRTLLKTVTAFTLGHSVTLALVSLDLIPNWPSLAELLIAATVLILALELSRTSTSDRQRSIRKRQWPVASLFGLIHGLGFANVLEDVGMPADDLMVALLSFNVGIEIGQLIFVGTVAGLLYVVKRWSAGGHQMIRALVVLAMGGISVFWCLDRGLEVATRAF